MKCIYVDLDGTLVKTDTLWEAVLGTLRSKPAQFLHAVTALFKGRSAFKDAITFVPDPALLPYNQDVLEYVRNQRLEGNRIILATAAHSRIANAVAAHTGLFHDVLATGSTRNLKGRNKADAILSHHSRTAPETPWTYVGNDKPDLAIWAVADEAVVVCSNPSLMREVAEKVKISAVFHERKLTLRHLLAQLRLYQWVKNLLVFMPLFLAHSLDSTESLVSGVLAFFAFCFCASALYSVNDLFDLEADRRHPSKKKRPLAAGALQVPFAIAMVSVLLLMSLACSVLVQETTFLLWILTYAVLALAYSVVLKRMPMLDVITLSGLYVIRILAGASATGTFVSPWLLMFGLFIFLTLAFLKRYTELRTAQQQEVVKVSGRGYYVSDVEIIGVFGPASGLIGILIFVLYLSGPDVQRLYDYPLRLWIAVPIFIYWLGRVWLLGHRDQVDDDPVLFVLRDKASYVVVGLLVAIVLWAW